ncbi:MAG: hypothetical protein J1E40_08590 [Oscillospiraceae bacterium]|nr:hypothetical protein [Oscillospiraceae bacterium]
MDPLKEEQFIYEKMADKSIKALRKQICLLYTAIGFMTALILTEIFMPDEILFTRQLIVLAVGTALGFGTGLLLVAKGNNIAGELSRLELSEGYTDATLEEAYRMMNKKQSNEWKVTFAIIVSDIHNYRGEFSKTVEILSAVDESIFRVNATNAHTYYSNLLMAYLLLDDLDHAADTFTKGFYYMNTYKDNPSAGVIVSQVLAVYEFYAGHYDVSMQLLDNAVRIGSSGIKQTEQRVTIPGENMTSIICYWKARNFFAMGDKASAWEMINSCKGFYKTPYYEQLSQKLLDDMAKETDHNKNYTDEELFEIGDDN